MDLSEVQSLFPRVHRTLVWSACVIPWVRAGVLCGSPIDSNKSNQSWIGWIQQSNLLLDLWEFNNIVRLDNEAVQPDSLDGWMDALCSLCHLPGSYPAGISGRSLICVYSWIENVCNIANINAGCSSIRCVRRLTVVWRCIFCLAELEVLVTYRPVKAGKYIWYLCTRYRGTLGYFFPRRG